MLSHVSAALCRGALWKSRQPIATAGRKGERRERGRKGLGIGELECKARYFDTDMISFCLRIKEKMISAPKFEYHAPEVCCGR